ncbi:MAG: type II toxin-antitoxin system VapC family toxin [Dehalococcoidia bacterium]|nr:type II toxin-antitoxin system VapC family toxin [Dehalococcoidia bacterium]
MPAYYIESSAWLKRYKSEIGSEVVNELLAGRTADEIFVTSHLSVLEVSTVAARLLKGRAITPSQYERMVGTFARDLSTHGVVILPLFHTLVQESMELLPQYPLRTGS